jgi:hypothetical protein
MNPIFSKPEDWQSQTLESNHFKINLSILVTLTAFHQPLWPLGALYGKSKGCFVKLNSNFHAFMTDLSVSINLPAHG